MLKVKIQHVAFEGYHKEIILENNCTLPRIGERIKCFDIDPIPTVTSIVWLEGSLKNVLIYVN
jgi:hypothetical protein